MFVACSSHRPSPPWHCLGWAGLCCGGCPVQSGMLAVSLPLPIGGSTSPGQMAKLLGASIHTPKGSSTSVTNPLPTCDSQKRLQTLPRVPWGAKSHQLSATAPYRWRCSIPLGTQCLLIAVCPVPGCLIKGSGLPARQTRVQIPAGPLLTHRAAVRSKAAAPTVGWALALADTWDGPVASPLLSLPLGGGQRKVKVGWDERM